MLTEEGGKDRFMAISATIVWASGSARAYLRHGGGHGRARHLLPEPRPGRGAGAARPTTREYPTYGEARWATVKPRRSSRRREARLLSCTSAVSRRQAGTVASHPTSPRTASAPRPLPRHAAPRPYPISADPSGAGACLRPHSPITS